MKKSIGFLFVLFSVNFALGQSSMDTLLKTYNSQSVPYISVEELRMFQINDSVVILDAREENEFKVSHLVSSINVGFNTFSSDETEIEKLSKNTNIVVYCSVGIRSEKIAEKLKKEGFSNVKNLYGGIFAWKNKGYPIIDSTGSETENVHTFSKVWSKYLIAGNPVY